MPVPPPDDEGGSVPDQPFSDPARDMIDPALRHRMISEAAYRRYVERGYADGYDLDDWLQAEAAVEQLLETAMRSEAVRTPESRSNDTAARGGQASAPHSVAHDEAMKRIIRQHPQRDIPRVESVEPGEAPPKE
ncbi:MAG: DUF2934 domain-containing protein [Betaproteobacteria bacterium]